MILYFGWYEYSLTDFFKIGKYNENAKHIRPIKIILDNETECQNILKNANKLKKLNTVKLKKHI